VLSGSGKDGPIAQWGRKEGTAVRFLHRFLKRLSCRSANSFVWQRRGLLAVQFRGKKKNVVDEEKKPQDFAVKRAVGLFAFLSTRKRKRRRASCPRGKSEESAATHSKKGYLPRLPEGGSKTATRKKKKGTCGSIRRKKKGEAAFAGREKKKIPSNAPSSVVFLVHLQGKGPLRRKKRKKKINIRACAGAKQSASYTSWGSRRRKLT